jgi:acyl-CoA synthetase (AMP-forming)/AMP-acid ligase II
MALAPDATATLGALLHHKAAEAADHRIFTFLGHDLAPAGEHTYGSLDRRAREVAAGLAGLEGERALVVFQPGLEFIEALYGCLYAGVIAVPCPPPDPGRKYAGPRIRTIVRDATPRVVLSPAALQESIAEVLAEGQGVADRPELVATDAASGDAPPVTADAGDVAVVQYTSGSTNVPRGVMVSHANVLDNCEFIGEGMELERDGGGLMWLPPYHDMGLIGGMFSPVHSGRPMTLMSPISFLMDPLNWLRAIGRYGASASGGPNFAFDLCVRRGTEADREGLNLSTWTTAYNGAESVRPETMEAFAEAFAPHGFRRGAFYPCYGLAEATLMVSGGDKAAGPASLAVDAAALEQGRHEPASEDRSIRLTSCGVPRPGAQVAIVDPDTREPVAGETIGEVWISGPSVGLGYWARETETASVFDAHTADGQGPFLRSGDLGFLSDGELYITGRISEVLVLDGRALYPTDVEGAAEAASSTLRHNCAAAFLIETGGRRRAALVAEVREDEEDLDAVYAAIRDGVRERLGIDLGAICLISPRTIPRTSSGKTRRGECRELFLRGQLASVGEWLDLG